jgi:hypothetical protein
MDQIMEYLPNETAEMKAAISASLDEMKVKQAPIKKKKCMPQFELAKKRWRL